MSVSVNADLHKERLSGSFKAEELTPYLFGAERTEKSKKLLKIISHNTAFETSDLWYISRQQRYMRACERALEYVKIYREHSLIDDEESSTFLEFLTGDSSFLALHLTMFIPAIENLANEEQAARWLPLAKDFRILGTYCQTELGHGSNVSGLQTTADLDITTDEWVLNTPVLESTKWWPGGLGKSCNCCVLMARLRIKGVDYGVHAFMLPLRCPETHRSLPGIFLFDIGQKLGYNGMDNGGMQLNNVRIPRENLLLKYFRVDREGNYSKVGDHKMLYTAMTYTRAKIIEAAGTSLSEAAIIGIRYSAVRRQFPRMDVEFSKESLLTDSDIPEAQVLDYSTQQYTLFPMLATSIGFIFASRFVNTLYQKMISEAKTCQNFSRLNEIHVVTSALKGAMTMIVIDGLEACRKSLGGHGYLLCAGVPLLYSSYVPQATYEGDFVVLSVQCGRGLLNMVQDKMSGKENTQSCDSTQQYVFDFDPLHKYKAPEEFQGSYLDNPADMVELFERRSCCMIYQCALRMQKHLASGLTLFAALDEEKIAFTRITKAHCHAVVLKAFKLYCDEAKSHIKIHTVLLRLLRLYCVYWMEAEFAEFVAAKGKLINTVSVDPFSFQQIRPDAVTIADGFGYPDFLLNSVLGRSDGNVYQALFESTKLEPLNQSDVSEGYSRYIQYILHPERSSKLISKI